MPGGGGGEKTEAATPKRRKDEREKGNVFSSKEVGPLVGLLAVAYTIQILGTYILSALVKGFNMFWGMAGNLEYLTLGDTRKVFVELAGVFAVAALPALLVAGLIAVVVTLAQTRGLVSFKSIQPKFSKLNPISGIKRMFSLRGLMELLKSIVKIIILAYVIYDKYMERFGELPRLMEMDFVNVLAYTADFVMDVLTSVAVVFVIVVAADYLYQRWQYEKDLRMSKQEIKEEYKQSEGDPQIKGKIRQKQREMSMNRMMQAVPEADVIIRNPTHYAVALKYESGQNKAPVVVAKGADLVALRIIKVGKENKVMAIENPPLARGLYDAVPLDREIPSEFYQAVAEVLAFVYNLQSKKLNVPAKN